jgi:hypothetical protein
MRELIYFSRRRLDAFFPERPPHSWPSTNLELNAQIAKVLYQEEGKKCERDIVRRHAGP